MQLDHAQSAIVFELMREIGSGRDQAEMRLRVGALLLRLLDARYLASYVWDEADGRFVDRVAIDMDDANLGAYEAHYQFHDPITPVLRRRRRATCVSEVIDRRRLERSEFFNDFLAPDGLHWGINFYAYAGDANIGDLRIWRGRGQEDFTRRDAQLLDAVGGALARALAAARGRAGGAAREDVCVLVERAGARAGLTRRQREIGALVMRGASDREICEALCIALPTVRTHLSGMFDRLGAGSRAQLAHRLRIEAGAALGAGDPAARGRLGSTRPSPRAARSWAPRRRASGGATGSVIE